jgi:hypothetical protein
MVGLMHKTGFTGKLISLGVGSACALGVVLLQWAHLAQQKQQAALDTYLEQTVKSQSLQLQLAQKLPTLGFRNLLADWAFLQFLQYFGDDEARKVAGYGLSPDFFEVILRRDPFFTETYNYLFASVSLYLGQPETTIALVDRSLQKMTPQFPPKSYYLWRNKALDELLLLNDVKGAMVSLETAAQWAEQSGDPEGAQVAQISRQMVQFLRTNPDSRIARSLAWSGVIVRAVDERSRELAIARIEALGGQVTITPGGAVQVFLPKQD